MNYMGYYLDYNIVRTMARGILILVSRLMLNDGDLASRFTNVRTSLYVFMAVSLYLVFHATCCFAEVKVV
jgi:hypothetical protein